MMLKQTRVQGGPCHKASSQRGAAVRPLAVADRAASHSSEDNACSIDRRQLMLQALVVGSAPAWLSRPAHAEVALEAPSTSAAASLPPQPFEDDDYTLSAPGGFKFVEIPYTRAERGPAPERSPIRCRFDAPDGGAVVSVVVRNAQMLRQTLLQVTDISAYGTPEEAASLLLPRGSKLVSASVETVALPPRVTPLGDVEVPPKSYYRYELLTPNGQHVAMAVAANRGKVFVCGCSADVKSWPKYAAELQAAAASFRLKDLGAAKSRA